MLGEIDLLREPSASSPPAAASAGPERRGSKDDRLGGLVLTRRVGESILIGDEVEVVVVGVRSGTARLKIMAPRSIAVHRREVFDAIRAGVAAPAAARPEGPAPARPGKPSGGLVLARMAGQSIRIGDDVEIAVVEVRPSLVKIRVAAPKSVPVHRREVLDRATDPA